MLQKALIPIDLSGGLDTKTDQKLVLPSSLVELENGIFTKGSVITKRNGYDSLSLSILGSTSISSASQIGTFKDELFTLAASTLYSYTPNKEAWINKGSFKPVGTTLKNVIRNTYTQTEPDVAIYEGVALFAWNDSSNGIRASLIDLDSGVSIFSDVLVDATATKCRCVTIDNELFVIYLDGANFLGRRVNPLNETALNSAFTIASDADTTDKFFDIVPIGTRAVWAYQNNGGDVTVGYLRSDEVVGSPLYGLPSPVDVTLQAENALTVYVNADADRIYIATDDTTNGLRVTELFIDLTENLAPTVIDATVSPVCKNVVMREDSAGVIQFYYQYAAASTQNHYVEFNTLTLPSTVGTPAVFKRGCGLASRVFQYDDVNYMVLAVSTTLQSTYFVVDEDGTIISKHLPSIGGGLRTAGIVSNVGNPATGQYLFANLIKHKLTALNDGVFTVTGVSRSLIDFVNTDFRAKELGNNLHITGGFLAMYDGQNIVEHGFHFYPENTTTTPATSGGSMADGTYSYSVVYQWTDYKGNVHYSSPGVAVSAVVSGGGGSGKVTLTIPTYRMTNKENVICEVYRTEASGTIYYRVGTVANSTTADTASYVDTTVDASIISLQLLYTTGGILDNIAPPACSVIGTFRNRVFVVSNEDKQTLFYSKGRIKNEAAEFSDALYLTVDQAKEITGLIELDEKFIIFEENKIFFITGEGPTATGDQNSFSEPQLITADAGCSNTDSLVLTPAGVMFQSNKGIYLLDRSLQAFYIGAMVEAYNDKTITSAVLLADKNQVRFTTSDQLALVYDYFFKKWSVFTNHAGLGAVNWLNTYVYLRSDGEVWQEDESSYLDKNKSISMKLVTAWIKLNGIQGLQRIWRASILGDYKSAHTLQVQIGYDFQQYYNEQHDFDFATSTGLETFGDDTPYGDGAYGGDSDGVFQFRVHLAKQKCQAIRFLFKDQMSDTTGQSYSLSNLQLEAGLKKGNIKKSATMSV